MATTPPPLTPFGGAAPQRGDKATFSSRVDAFVTWLIAVVTQFIALAANVYANAQEAFVSAGTATSAAATAAATANATPWVSGAIVQQYACMISPADGRTYRRTSATGAGTTDPAADGGNYVAMSSIQSYYMKVSDRKASSTSGGNSPGALTQRTLNTVDWNDIAGASLSSSIVTLPVGTYEVSIRVPGYNPSGHQAYLYNITDSVIALIGSSAYTYQSGNAQSDCIVSGRFIISSPKQFKINHYANASATNGLGIPVTSGQSEVYTEATFKKVA